MALEGFMESEDRLLTLHRPHAFTVEIMVQGLLIHAHGLNRPLLVHESAPLHWLYVLGQFPDPPQPQFPPCRNGRILTLLRDCWECSDHVGVSKVRLLPDTCLLNFTASAAICDSAPME